MGSPSPGVTKLKKQNSVAKAGPHRRTPSMTSLSLPLDSGEKDVPSPGRGSTGRSPAATSTLSPAGGSGEKPMSPAAKDATRIRRRSRSSFGGAEELVRGLDFTSTSPPVEEKKHPFLLARGGGSRNVARSANSPSPLNSPGKKTPSTPPGKERITGRVNSPSMPSILSPKKFDGLKKDFASPRKGVSASEFLNMNGITSSNGDLELRSVGSEFSVEEAVSEKSSPRMSLDSKKLKSSPRKTEKTSPRLSLKAKGDTKPKGDTTTPKGRRIMKSQQDTPSPPLSGRNKRLTDKAARNEELSKPELESVEVLVYSENELEKEVKLEDAINVLPKGQEDLHRGHAIEDGLSPLPSTMLTHAGEEGLRTLDSEEDRGLNTDYDLQTSWLSGDLPSMFSSFSQSKKPDDVVQSLLGDPPEVLQGGLTVPMTEVEVPASKVSFPDGEIQNGLEDIEDTRGFMDKGEEDDVVLGLFGDPPEVLHDSRSEPLTEGEVPSSRNESPPDVEIRNGFEAIEDTRGFMDKGEEDDVVLSYLGDPPEVLHGDLPMPLTRVDVPSPGVSMGDFDNETGREAMDHTRDCMDKVERDVDKTVRVPDSEFPCVTEDSGAASNVMVNGNSPTSGILHTQATAMPTTPENLVLADAKSQSNPHSDEDHVMNQELETQPEDVFSSANGGISIISPAEGAVDIMYDGEEQSMSKVGEEISPCTPPSVTGNRISPEGITEKGAVVVSHGADGSSMLLEVEEESSAFIPSSSARDVGAHLSHVPKLAGGPLEVSTMHLNGAADLKLNGINHNQSTEECKRGSMRNGPCFEDGAELGSEHRGKKDVDVCVVQTSTSESSADVTSNSDEVSQEPKTSSEVERPMKVVDLQMNSDHVMIHFEKNPSQVEDFSNHDLGKETVISHAGHNDARDSLMISETAKNSLKVMQDEAEDSKLLVNETAKDSSISDAGQNDADEFSLNEATKSHSLKVMQEVGHPLPLTHELDNASLFLEAGSKDAEILLMSEKTGYHPQVLVQEDVATASVSTYKWASEILGTDAGQNDAEDSVINEANGIQTSGLVQDNSLLPVSDQADTENLALDEATKDRTLDVVQDKAADSWFSAHEMGDEVSFSDAGQNDAEELLTSEANENQTLKVLEDAPGKSYPLELGITYSLSDAGRDDAEHLVTNHCTENQPLKIVQDEDGVSLPSTYVTVDESSIADADQNGVEALVNDSVTAHGIPEMTQDDAGILPLLLHDMASKSTFADAGQNDAEELERNEVILSQSLKVVQKSGENFSSPVEMPEPVFPDGVEINLVMSEGVCSAPALSSPQVGPNKQVILEERHNRENELAGPAAPTTSPLLLSPSSPHTEQESCNQGQAQQQESLLEHCDLVDEKGELNSSLNFHDIFPSSLSHVAVTSEGAPLKSINRDLSQCIDGRGIESAVVCVTPILPSSSPSSWGAEPVDVVYASQATQSSEPSHLADGREGGVEGNQKSIVAPVSSDWSPVVVVDSWEALTADTPTLDESRGLEYDDATQELRFEDSPKSSTVNSVGHTGPTVEPRYADEDVAEEGHGIQESGTEDHSMLPVLVDTTQNLLHVGPSKADDGRVPEGDSTPELGSMSPFVKSSDSDITEEELTEAAFLSSLDDCVNHNEGRVGSVLELSPRSKSSVRSGNVDLPHEPEACPDQIVSQDRSGNADLPHEPESCPDQSVSQESITKTLERGPPVKDNFLCIPRSESFKDISAGKRDQETVESGYNPFEMGVGAMLLAEVMPPQTLQPFVFDGSSPNRNESLEELHQNVAVPSFEIDDMGQQNVQAEPDSKSAEWYPEGGGQLGVFMTLGVEDIRQADVDDGLQYSSASSEGIDELARDTETEDCLIIPGGEQAEYKIKPDSSKVGADATQESPTQDDSLKELPAESIEVGSATAPSADHVDALLAEDNINLNGDVVLSTNANRHGVVQELPEEVANMQEVVGLEEIVRKAHGRQGQPLTEDEEQNPISSHEEKIDAFPEGADAELMNANTTSSDPAEEHESAGDLLEINLDKHVETPCTTSTGASPVVTNATNANENGDTNSHGICRYPIELSTSPHVAERETAMESFSTAASSTGQNCGSCNIHESQFASGSDPERDYEATRQANGDHSPHTQLIRGHMDGDSGLSSQKAEDLEGSRRKSREDDFVLSSKADNLAGGNVGKDQVIDTAEDSTIMDASDENYSAVCESAQNFICEEVNVDQIHDSKEVNETVPCKSDPLLFREENLVVPQDSSPGSTELHDQAPELSPILGQSPFSSSQQDRLWEEQAEAYSSGGRGTPARNEEATQAAFQTSVSPGIDATSPDDQIQLASGPINISGQDVVASSTAGENGGNAHDGKTGKGKPRTPLRSLLAEDATKGSEGDESGANGTTHNNHSFIRRLFRVMSTPSRLTSEKESNQAKQKKLSKWSSCLGMPQVQ